MARQLRMVRPNLAGLPQVEIPEGYEIRTYQEGDDVHWANVISDSFGGERTAEDARRDIMDRDVFDPEGLYFATYRGTPVGTTCAWKDTPDEIDVGIVHMVGVHSDHTGHKLGRCVTLSVLLYLRDHNFKCAKLGTDDFRLPAIKTYLNLGFLPVYVDVTQPDRWREIFRKLDLPVMSDQSEKIKAKISDEMWAKVTQ